MDSEGTQVPSLLGSSLTCLVPTGCSQALTLRGVPAGETSRVTWWAGMVSAPGRAGLRLFKQETDKLWVVSFLWEFLSE